MTLREPWRLPPQSTPARFYQWRLTRGELAAILAWHGCENVKIVYKRQGLQRRLQSKFGINSLSFVTKALAALLSPFVPGIVIGHMIIFLR
jgi:hypothetical protein